MNVPPLCPRCGGPVADVLSGLCPACLLKVAFAETGGPAQAATPDVSGRSVGVHPERIGPYRILEILGEGGMGVVYLAEQREPLRRQVALKVIKLGMDTRAVVARFEAERQALAVMDHPNIAAVFDAGATDDGRPYFVMEYVAGVPITEYCDVARLATRARLTLFIQVCNAIQHAHQKAVIHRDIKPSNVLVAVQDGQPTPKVIDFGVAKATGSPLATVTFFTQHGQLVGTPEYMSPEQADRAQTDVDATTDIYSLGVVLYELLAGALPFDPIAFRRAGMNEMLRIVCEDDPPRPSTRLSTLGDSATAVANRRRTEIRALRRELAGDLDWIVLRAMEKDRARRYPSASEFAADIGRYLRVEPVLASPPSLTYRARKFVRRHRISVASAFLVLLAMVGASILSTTMYLRGERARRDADEQRQVANRGQLEADAQRRRAEDQTRAAIAAQQKADERGKEAEHQAYAATISAANFALQVSGSRGVRDRLDALPERLRRWEWGFLAFSADPSLQTTQLIRPPYDRELTDLLVATSDGKRLLLRGVSHVHALDAVNPARDSTSYAASGSVLAIGQGGLALVIPTGGVAPRPRTVHLVNVATGRVLHAFPSELSPECAAISADNTRAVVAAVRGESMVITVWDATSGDRLSSITTSEVPKGPRPRCIVATSPDGSVVLSGRNKLEAWSSSTGVPIPTVDVPPSQTVPNGSQGVLAAGPGFAAIAVSADGRRAAIGRADGSVAVLDLTSRPIRVQIVQTNGVRALALSPNGERLAVAATRVSLWSVRETARLLSWFDHDSLVDGLAFSSDGDRLVGLCGNGQVHTWRTTYMAATTRLDDAPALQNVTRWATSHIALSPSGRLVAFGNLDGTVLLWRLSDASQMARWTLPESMATGSPRLPTWLVRPASPLAVHALSFSGDERVLALGYENGAVGMRRVPSGETVRQFAAHTSSVTAMATSADGRWLATGALDGTARVWDWATGALQAVFRVNGTDAVNALAFRRDHSLLVGSTPFVLGSPPTMFLWDWRSQRTLASVVVPWSGRIGQFATPIAINPADGRIAMAVGQSDSAVSIWDSELTREVGRLVGTGGNGEMRSVDFTPDGERLVTAELGGGIRIWSADRLELLAVLDVGAEFVRFTPDGRRLIAAGSEISVLDSGAPKSSPVPRLVLTDRLSPNADRSVQKSPEPTSQRVPEPTLRAFLSTWVFGEATGAPMVSDLMRLTVPGDQLPAGCLLAPAPTQGGPVPTNPAMVTDARLLDMMHAEIFLPLPEDPAGAQGTLARSRAIREAAPGRAARVEAGYVAAYREEGGFDEIGVFALRLKDPSAEAPIPNTPRSTTITKGSVVIFSWIDGRPASPDRGCVDVVRRHIASVDLK